MWASRRGRNRTQISIGRTNSPKVGSSRGRSYVSARGRYSGSCGSAIMRRWLAYQPRGVVRMGNLDRKAVCRQKNGTLHISVEWWNEEVLSKIRSARVIAEVGSKKWSSTRSLRVIGEVSDPWAKPRVQKKKTAQLAIAKSVVQRSTTIATSAYSSFVGNYLRRPWTCGVWMVRVTRCMAWSVHDVGRRLNRLHINAGWAADGSWTTRKLQRPLSWRVRFLY